ncbi:hypothetical protein IEQ34_022207 [Dendrobium chrysotoxum]|uniref:Copine C-terminal domain-containing protein n=1 Tax=Dendrobium chrysotoxum TaxID=161865 RepID=A0AAV7FWZ3_DENCH|nr:hypothetical protein IEQ34_022207 [Dendrobium chrysotoxum]
MQIAVAEAVHHVSNDNGRWIHVYDEGQYSISNGRFFIGLLCFLQKKGKYCFNNQSLHAIGDKPNPYEEAISIIGKTLAPFDEDNFIPCFGFGDATTHDREVFSFHGNHSPYHGFDEVLDCYRKIVPKEDCSKFEIIR